MKYYWNQLLYALGLKHRPDPLTPVQIINQALEIINADKAHSETENQLGIDALNAMIKDWDGNVVYIDPRGIYK